MKYHSNILNVLFFPFFFAFCLFVCLFVEICEYFCVNTKTMLFRPITSKQNSLFFVVDHGLIFEFLRVCFVEPKSFLGAEIFSHLKKTLAFFFDKQYFQFPQKRAKQTKSIQKKTTTHKHSFLALILGASWLEKVHS